MTTRDSEAEADHEPATGERPTNLDSARRIRAELLDTLAKMVRFWQTRAIDPAGGYHTCFDYNGNRSSQTEPKCLVTQSRLVWAFTEFSAFAHDSTLLNLARHGADYLTTAFHDDRHGGWFWTLNNGGAPLDTTKVTYGQSFAIYALAHYGRISGDARAVDAAADGFRCLQAAAMDDLHGGYREALSAQWSVTLTPEGERKTLDTHMHMLESLTELVQTTGDAAHRAALADVESLLFDKMIDQDSGAGGTQFARDWTPLLPIALPRTWVAERAPNASTSDDWSTSYGHNLELAWLTIQADDALGHNSAAHRRVVERLAAHALQHGLDRTHGGIYREGSYTGPPADRDKEFWQNSEAMPGFLSAYRMTRDLTYYDAFVATWQFARHNLVHPRFGEWCVRTAEDGRLLDGDLGNQWKVCYHTGRAIIECLQHLGRL